MFISFIQMAPLFKLLNVLARNYNVNLIKAQCIESIFAPLLKCNSSCYFKLPIVDVTMYLECLAMLSTLLEFRIIEIKLNLFQETNIKHLVAMSIKHGNTGKIFKTIFRNVAPIFSLFNLQINVV